MNSLRLLAIAACIATCLGAPSAATAQLVGPFPLGQLGLATSASVEVTKDVLALTFSTTRDGADANAVQAQLKQALDAAVVEAKKAARPGQLEVQTGNFALYPRHTNKGGIAGWQGTAELIVEGRDLQAIAQLTGRITTMTIARVAYRLSREATQKVEADIAAEAIARFRARAADYARQFGYAGYTIAQVNVSVSDPPQGGMPMMRMQAAGAQAGDALAVEPGKAVVTASVQGTVQMK